MRKVKLNCQQTNIMGFAHKPGATNKHTQYTQFTKQLALQNVILFQSRPLPHSFIQACFISVAQLQFILTLSKKGLFAYIQCRLIKVNKNICPLQKMHLIAKPSSTKQHKVALNQNKGSSNIILGFVLRLFLMSQLCIVIVK